MDRCEIYEEHVAQTSVAKVSPDGTSVASGDLQGYVRIWDVRTKTLKHASKALSGPVRDISWTHDNSRVAVVGGEAGQGATALVFVVASGQPCGEIMGHAKAINACSFGPADQLVTVADDGLVVLHKDKRLRFEGAVGNHGGRFVQDVAFSNDGRFVASVGSDGRALLFEGTSGVLLAELIALKQTSIYGLAWSPCSGFLFLACADGVGRIIDVARRTVQQEIAFGHTSSLLDRQQAGCLWIKDTATDGSSLIISVAMSGQMTMVRPTGQIVRTLQRPTTGIVALTGLGATGFYAVDQDGRLFRWHKDQVWHCLPLSLPVSTVHLVQPVDAQQVFVLREDKRLLKLQLDKDVLKVVAELAIDVFLKQVVCVDEHMVLGISDEAVLLLQMDEAAVVRQTCQVRGGCSRMLYLETLQMVVVGHVDGRVSLFRLVGHVLEPQLEDFSVGTGAISALAMIGPDDEAEGKGGLLAVGDMNRGLRLFQVVGHKEGGGLELRAVIQHEWVFHASGITGLAWAVVDGQQQLFSSSQHQVIRSAPKRPMEYLTIGGHGSPLCDLLFLEDVGVVVGSRDGAIHIFNSD